MESPGRILGLDVGEARTGVALSDPLGMIASPHSVVPSADVAQAVAAIARLVEETGAVGIVVGVPLNQEGQPGPQAEKVAAFAEQLRRAVPVDVVTQDERYSTAAAQRTLAEAGVRGKKKKRVVDKVAAAHILQVYLDRAATERRRATDG